MKELAIEELGLTRQREVVLRTIREADAHLTANEVFAAAKSMLPTISFATVYNSLRYLKEALSIIIDLSFSLTAVPGEASVFGLDGAATYLFEYPYGCVEQQTSRIRPLLAGGDLLEAFDLEVLGGERQAVIEAYLNRLRRPHLYDSDASGTPVLESVETDDALKHLAKADALADMKATGFVADDDDLIEDEDDGPGIPDAIQTRIFDPIFTPKEPGKGTGLGLSTTHRIVVEKHRGDLRVDSRPGSTRFTVRLPYDAAIVTPGAET